MAADIAESLSELAFTAEMTAEQLEKLSTLAARVFFGEGQMLFRERDVGEFVYLVEEGQVALDIHVPGKGRTSILTIGPGQLVGWSSLFPSGRKTATARAVRPTRAIAFNAAQLREAIQEDHDLGCALLWKVAEVIAGRLTATRLQLLDIFAPSPA